METEVRNVFREVFCALRRFDELGNNSVAMLFDKIRQPADEIA